MQSLLINFSFKAEHIFVYFINYVQVLYNVLRFRISSNGMEAMEDEGLDSDADVDIGDSDAEEDSDADEDLAIEMEDNRPKADEMGVEHLATLERLRQNQRQDYLKVRTTVNQN